MVAAAAWHPTPREGLADLEAIIARARSAWRPPPRLSLSQWADANFVIGAASGAQPGRWHTLPYQREILDAITDPKVSMVVVMKSARIGYTLCVTAAIAYFIDQDPSSMLVVQPTVDDAKGFSKETIAPMLRDVPALAKLTYRDSEDKGRGPKDSSATLTHKAFPGGVLSLVGANSASGFRRISRRVVIFDEVDGYPPGGAGQEGDQIKLGMKRSEAFHDRKTIAGSTPTIAGVSRIEDMFLAGDQRRYYVPCPHCGHRDFLVFDQKSSRGHVMRWPDGKPEDAYFECRGNGCKIEHKSKRWMVERGEWIAENPAGTHRSYHLWSAVSYSPNARWEDISREFIAAKNDPLKLRTFVNTMLGETWQERGEAPAWELLHRRRETYPIGSVPDGVLVITAGVDVQQDRFVYEVVGWGENKESWSIDAGTLDGDTTRPEAWAKLDEFADRTYEGSDGAIHTIMRVAIDSGYRTQAVYGWAHRRGRARVMATKGMAGVRPILDAPSKQEITINGRKIKRGMILWPVGVDTAKVELYGWLGLPLYDDGSAPPGYCHFPEHPEEFFRQLTAEHLVETVNKKGRRTREWHVLPNRENHQLDCRVLARAAVFSLRIDYRRPGPKAPKPAPTTSSASAPSAPPAAPQPAAKPRQGFWSKPGGGRPGGWFGRRR